MRIYVMKFELVRVDFIGPTHLFTLTLKIELLRVKLKATVP